MPMDRRRFLSATTVALGGALGGGLVAPSAARPAAARPFDPFDWDSVRGQFSLDPALADLSALYLASHPHPVRDAIANHRMALDRSPTLHVDRHDRPRTLASIAAAARYMGAGEDEVALVDSTTSGLGILYGGMPLRAGQEVLTTSHDYYVTHEALRLAAARTGATVRKVRLHDGDAAGLTPEAMVERIAGEIRPETRVLALTWVHSGTGLKLPLRAIADAARARAGDRPAPDRLLLAVDGVHGFGVEDVDVPDLGFDFFVAGCHKWLFGPRGTGVVWGRESAWREVRPTIPSFLASELWTAWMQGRDPGGGTTARRMTPGGFRAFEHRWALETAFDFHAAIGRARVAERTHALARRLKDGLLELPHVRLATPMAESVSSGIVCFDVAGRAPNEVVDGLLRRGIVATVTPYARRFVRLAPSIRNTEGEVDAAVEAVAALGPAAPPLERTGV